MKEYSVVCYRPRSPRQRRIRRSLDGVVDIVLISSGDGRKLRSIGRTHQWKRPTILRRAMFAVDEQWNWALS
jgi:hypothetical protein